MEGGDDYLERLHEIIIDMVSCSDNCNSLDCGTAHFSDRIDLQLEGKLKSVRVKLDEMIKKAQAHMAESKAKYAKKKKEQTVIT